MASVVHTLFLWPVGNFPRRLSYYLLLKGLVASAKDLARGKTTTSTLRLNIITLNVETDEWDTSIPNDPVPEGYRMPCLRIDDASTGRKTWLHESTSILLYLEETYPTPEFNGTNARVRALNSDMIGIINEAIEHSKTYALHASKLQCIFTGFPTEARTSASAQYAKQCMNEALVTLRTWSKDAGGLSVEHPWLAAPGSSDLGPGLPDLCLAAWLRYMFLSRHSQVLDTSEHAPLIEWRNRIEGTSWWKAAEDQSEGPAVQPDHMTFAKDDLEF